MNTTRVSAETVWKYISKMPPAISGSGGHLATLAVARALVGFDLSETEAMNLFRQWNEMHCQPKWNEAELVHKLRTVAPKFRGYLLRDGYRPARTMMINRPKLKPQIDPVTCVENYLKGFRLSEVDLWELSPIRPDDDWKRDPVLLLETLYQPNEQINIVSKCSVDADGKATPDGYGTTLTREQWVRRILLSGPPEGRGGCWFRFNPTDGEGVGDANIANFRYGLIESDRLPLELQLSLYSKLPLPITALLSSGGRSIHCLIRVDAADATNYRETMTRTLALLDKFGIDQKNKNPSRMSRLPGTQRIAGAEGDGMQKLIYLNRNPQQKRIHE